MKSFIENIEVLTHHAYNLTQKHKKFGNYSSFIETNEGLVHRISQKCEHCKSGFDEKNYKCLHHDHITGKYIATVCNDCNIKLQYKRFVPVQLKT